MNRLASCINALLVAGLVALVLEVPVASAARTSPTSLKPEVPLEYAVWPPVQAISGAGPAITASPHLKLSSSLSHSVIDEAFLRFNDVLASVNTVPSSTSEQQLLAVHVNVPKDASDALSEATDYRYNITVEAGKALIEAQTVYGAMYGLDSIGQMLGKFGQLPHASLRISDGPNYSWRGLMIDSGRRFFPMPLVKNLLQTMAANKMNVLHLHASDFCRFSVESKTFPNLTNALTGILGGHYSQDDIRSMIAYAKNLGIRVVPEFDIPGHSRGFLPIESQGIHFCSDDASRNQLYNDPKGETVSVLKKLFAEIAPLFEDDVFEIGCDETSVKGPCSLNSTFSLERDMLQYITGTLKKTPAGWEEVYFDAKAATNNTIVDAWSRHPASEVVATGHRAIESASSHFYFTSPGQPGPAGWSRCWYDISSNIPAANLSLLLGGEISMWSDNYCYIKQCGAFSGSPPPGAKLFSPDNDEAFSKSIGGMIWPRGYVAAAAFWNYNTSADPSSAGFVNAIYSLNDMLQKQGSYVCPSNCSCDELTACGKPYLEPKAGSIAIGSVCDLSADPNQQFDVGDGDGTNLQLKLHVNNSLCLGVANQSEYQLQLVTCGSSDGNDLFTRDTGSLAISHKNTAKCLDMNTQTGQVGLWQCGNDQPNQRWAIDSKAGLIVSLSDYTDGGSSSTRSFYAGTCVTV